MTTQIIPLPKNTPVSVINKIQEYLIDEKISFDIINTDRVILKIKLTEDQLPHAMIYGYCIAKLIP